MNPFVGWLTNLLASIIRPIIQGEIENLRAFLVTQYRINRAYAKYDEEAQKLMEEMANASTSEERWAILQKIKNARASILP
jgi:hypothetical protein